jgi:RNA polymerase sigma-70 factor, ECF subfamily
MAAPPPSTAAGDEELDDAAIVDRVVAGDREAFRLLVERHQHRVFRLALRLSGGDSERAEDLSQEAFLRAYRGLAAFEHGSKFSTWLHRITVNVAISAARKRRAAKRGRTTLSLDAPLFGDEDRKHEHAVANPGPAHEVVTEESRRAVLQAVETLEPGLRKLVVLVHLEGQSYEVAAEILSIPIGTVRSRLHRAREILERRLQKWLPTR